MAPEQQDDTPQEEEGKSAGGGAVKKIKILALPAVILVLGFAGAHMLFPPPPGPPPLDPYAEMELDQVVVPEATIANIKGSGNPVFVVKIALDFRAKDTAKVKTAAQDEAFLNRVRDVLNEFYAGKSREEIEDTNTWAIEKRQLIERLQSLFFPDPTQGRLEKILFLQRNIQS